MTALTSFVDVIQTHTRTDVSVHTAGVGYQLPQKRQNQLSEKHTHTDTLFPHIHTHSHINTHRHTGSQRISDSGR